MSSTNLLPNIAGLNFHVFKVFTLTSSSTLKPLDSETFMNLTFPFLSILACIITLPSHPFFLASKG